MVFVGVVCGPRKPPAPLAATGELQIRHGRPAKQWRLNKPRHGDKLAAMTGDTIFPPIFPPLLMAGKQAAIDEGDVWGVARHPPLKTTISDE